MDILIDTHALIWYVEGSEMLSAKARQTISNPENLRYISIASIWEIGIKTNLGKLALNSNLATIRKLLLKTISISCLSITTVFYIGKVAPTSPGPLRPDYDGAVNWPPVDNSE